MNKRIIGRVIRARRDKKKLLIEDLAGADISPGTISRIENGTNVTDEKFYCLVGKLGLSVRELVRSARELEKEDERLYFNLLGIESILDRHGEEGLSKTRICLKTIEDKANKHHPYHLVVIYLKGKKWRVAGKYDKATKHFHSVLEETDRNPTNYEFLNMKSATLNELAYTYYLKNDIQKAIFYSEEGIKSFVEGGERQYLKHTLQSNLALYYEKMGDYKQTENVLKELWTQYKDIDRSPVKVKMFAIQSRIFKRERKYKLMVEYLRKGIQIARINYLTNDEFALWVDLGDFYLSKGDHLAAENCLVSANNLAQMSNIGKHHFKVLLYLSKLYLEIERFNDAENHIKQAIEIAKKYNDGLKQIEALIVMSEIYGRQHKVSETIIKLNQAQSLAKDASLLNKEIEILDRLNYYHNHMGNKGEIKEILHRQYILKK